LSADGHKIEAGQPQTKIAGKISYIPEGATDSKRALKPGEKYELVRHIFPSDHYVGAIGGEAARARGVASQSVSLHVVEGNGADANRWREWTFISAATGKNMGRAHGVRTVR